MCLYVEDFQTRKQFQIFIIPTVRLTIHDLVRHKLIQGII